METQQGKRRDIEERTFRFATRIVRLCMRLGERPGASRTLGQQLLRSGTSIGANVEEGQAAQNRADFICKNSIALKEARETRYWLRPLMESGLLPSNVLTDLLTEATEIANILGAIVARCRANS
jgi:four helix bundle protein